MSFWYAGNHRGNVSDHSGNPVHLHCILHGRLCQRCRSALLIFFFISIALPAIFPSTPLTHVASHMLGANCQHCSLAEVTSLDHCRKSQHAKCHSLQCILQWLVQSMCGGAMCSIWKSKVHAALGTCMVFVRTLLLHKQSLLCFVLHRCCEHTDWHQLQVALCLLFAALAWHTALLAASPAKH